MTELHLIPDTSDKEVDWSLIPEGGLELVAVATAPSPLSEVHSHFSKNVMTTILARVVNMARGVVLVPFLLRHLGLEAYGIWTTIFILVSYVGVSTLGISNVYIKYVAEFHARREYDKANALLSTGLAITIPLCSAIFLGFLWGWKWYAPWLHLPPAHVADGKEAVLIVLGVFLSAIALSGFGDILTATQQIASTQWFLMMGIVAEMAVIVWLVGGGRGIRGLAEAYLVRVLFTDGLSIWWAWKKLKWLHISPRLVRRDSIRYVVHFGGMVQFQSMLDIFLASVERVAALGLIGAAAAGLLDVAKKWPVALSTVPMAFFWALLPAAAHVDASSSDSDRLRNLRGMYLSSSRYANLCTSAFVAAIALWAAPILHVWLGPQLPMGQGLIALFVVFSLATQFHMLTGPGTSMFRGMGRVYEEFTYSIPNLLLLGITLPASRWIEGRWTPFGIGVAVAVATAVSACVLMGRVLFVLHLGLAQFVRVVIVPGLAPYAIAGLLAWPVVELVALMNRWQGAGILFSAGILYLAAVMAVLEPLGVDRCGKETGNRMVPPGPGSASRQGGNCMNRRMHIASILPLVFAGLTLAGQEPPLPLSQLDGRAAPAQATAATEPATQGAGPQLKPNPLDALRSFEPDPNEAYRLGKGDEIAVDFAGRPDLAAKLVVGPDGCITLPLAGDLKIDGLTRPEASKAIAAALGSYYDNLAVQVTVTRYTSNRVLVLGAVATPGEVTFEGTPTLLEALSRSGLETTGPNKIAQIPERCAVYRGNDQVVWVELRQLIESGNTLADLRLRRDDVIYVPSNLERFVSVLGEVEHPGAVPLTSSSTLASVLADAGGLTDNAGNNAHIQIVDPITGSSRVLTFKDVLNPAKSLEVTLKPGEIVFVPKTGFAKATYVLQRLNPMFQLSSLAYLGAVL